MSVNEFRPRKYEDFEIVDGSAKVVGHVRIKPSGILWAPSNAKMWHGVSLAQFADFMVKNGRKKKK